MSNMVVAHYLDHRVVKGHSEDVRPNKEAFHLTEAESGETAEIQLADLKAVFFVKSLEGDSEYQPDLGLERPGFGRKIKVRFKDGEKIVGYTSGYSPQRLAFFFFPADPKDNNDRVLVVNAATEKVEFV